MGETVQVILEAVDKASTTINKVDGELNKLTKTTGQVTKTTGAASKATSGFTSQLADMGRTLAGPLVQFTSLTGLVLGVTNLIRSSVTDWVAYNEEIRKLGIATSTSTEDLSRMVQAADDVGVSMSAMQMALKLLAKNGIQPTIKNVAELSDRLLAIKDPTLRAEEAAKLFGRGWAEISSFVLQGSDAIYKATSSIEDNLVVTQQSAQQARDYSIAMDNLGDTVQGLKNQLAQELIPTIIEFTNSLTELVKLIGMVEDATGGLVDISTLLIGPIMMLTNITEKWGEQITDFSNKYTVLGLIYKNKTDDMTESTDKLTVATNNYSYSAKDQIAWMGVDIATKAENVTETEQLSYQQEILNIQMMTSAQYAVQYTGAMKPLVKTTGQAAKAIESAATAAKRLGDELSKVPTDIGSQIMRDLEALDFRGAGAQYIEELRIGVMGNLAKGLITEDEARKALGGLFIAFEAIKVQIGDVSRVEAWQAVKDNLSEWGLQAEEAQRLFDELLGFDGKKIDMQAIINFVATWTGTSGVPGSGSPWGGTGGSGGGGGGGRQMPQEWSTGGSFIVPPGFPNDTFPMWVESGELVQVVPSSQVGDLFREYSMLDSIVSRPAGASYNTTSTSYNVPITVNATMASDQDVHRAAYVIAQEFNRRTRR